MKIKRTLYIPSVGLLLLLSLCMIILLAYQSFTQIEATARERKASFLLINQANNLMSSLIDAETGQRGYLLTGNQAFLKPYNSVRDTVASELTTLRQHISNQATRAHLDRLVPLVDAKMAELSNVIAFRASGDTAAAIDVVKNGKGMRLMDEIRSEMRGFMQVEDQILKERDALFQSKLRRMFILIISASICNLLLAVSFAYLILRNKQQQFKINAHQETERLLKLQEETNTLLHQANVELLEKGITTHKLLNELELSQLEIEGQNTELRRSQLELEHQQIELEFQNEELGRLQAESDAVVKMLRESEEQLAVTLNSIGDGVIATDGAARVVRLNPIAEQLTGWTQAEAVGQLVEDIFHIINKESRKPAPIPIMDAIIQGTTQGLASHTILIARDGKEYDIADSCAPIRSRNDQIVGAVLVFRNVSEEYAVAQSLRDSGALVTTILNTVADGIITIHASSGFIETVNPAAERMFDYNGPELAGQNFSLLIPGLDQNEGTDSLEYYCASEEERAGGFCREVIGRRSNGVLFPLEMTISEMWLNNQRYFTGILRDITARTEAEAALLKAGALQKAIFNSANFSSIATDAQGVIQIFNVGAERMLGYSAAEVMDKITPADLSDPLEVIARATELSRELETPLAPGFETLVFKASRGIEDIYELTYIRKDGSRFPAVVSVTALRDAQDDIIGYLLIGTDNSARNLIESERLRLEQVLLDKNLELEKAMQITEKANLAKSDFLSSMSHELRTPLSAILGFAQLLESGIPPPTSAQLRSVDQILKAGWYLLELINEILDLALIESGKLSMSLEPVPLMEVLIECEAMIEPQANNRGIAVSFNHCAPHCCVKADRTRLKQVLINLLSNAIKYNRIGGTVVVKNTVSRDSVRISVTDTGYGLDHEQLIQLFQPFNRLGQEANTEQGTGIGLVVAKRLMEWMDGTIGVESCVGQGSTFWIELPLTMHTKQSDVISEDATLSQRTVHTSEPLYTLLYVEDNPANLMLVEDIIARRPDIRLLSARDGRSGIALARSALPDVILMDINLPGISGIDAMKILIVDQTTAHIPVVALSANALPIDIERGLKAGFFRYLTKPIKVNEFLLTLEVAFAFAKAGNKKELS